MAAGAYQATSGFASAEGATRVSRRMERNWDVSTDGTPKELVLGAIFGVGPAFGIGYLGMQRVVPLPRPVCGALYGTGFWALAEGLFRLAPRRGRGEWALGPPSKAAARLAASGVVVSIAAGP
jgi:hypothetical protein